MLFFVYNGLKMNEYEAYWQIDFPLFNSLAPAKKNYDVL